MPSTAPPARHRQHGTAGRTLCARAGAQPADAVELLEARGPRRAAERGAARGGLVPDHAARGERGDHALREGASKYVSK